MNEKIYALRDILHKLGLQDLPEKIQVELNQAKGACKSPLVAGGLPLVFDGMMGETGFMMS